MVIDRIPVVGQPRRRIDVGLEEKVDPELMPGQVGGMDQLRQNQNDDAEDA